jgi:hypothetical protein
MVIRLSALFAVIVLSTPVSPCNADQGQITLLVSDMRVELGRALTIRLESRLPGALDRVDLSPLEQGFAVQDRGRIERDHFRQTFVRRVQVYPRRIGELEIPSLGQGARASKPVLINVGPAIDRRDRSEIKVQSEISASDLWLKQGFHVSVEIETGSEIVDIDTPAFEESGFDAHVLPPESHARSARTVHRVGWVIHPLKAGTNTLRLPAIQFKRDGVVTHRFFPPIFAVNVKPLPSYIPVTMPVGRVDVDIAPATSVLATTGRLAYRELNIEAEGLPAQFINFVNHQLVSTGTSSIYPAELQSDIRFVEGKAVTRLDYHVPFVANGIGISHLPSLRIQVFDPDKGKLVTQEVMLGSTISVPRWLQVTLAILCLLAVAYLVVLAGGITHAYWLRFMNYRNASSKIKAATTADDLRQALALISTAESWPNNVTLEKWLGLWTQQCFHSSRLTRCLVQLQAVIYGRAVMSMDTIRQDLLQACYQRMPLLKLVNHRVK